MNKIVKCPICSKEVAWIETSTYRPFCSERCRLIDLGEWASEKHAIPNEPIPSTEEFSFSLNNKDDNY